jgi:tetratricopeptide (TPR) repeat protein
LFAKEQYESAISLFNKCLIIDPLNFSYNTGILFNIGLCQVKQGKNQEALHFFNKSLALSPNHEKSLNQRAQTYVKLEFYQEAIDDFQRVTSFDVKVQLLEA